MWENDMPDVHLDLIRDPARKFPSVADPELVRSARVWHCKYKSLVPLGALCNLEELVIATFPDESFEFLGKLSELRFLQIVHMPKICDISPLSRLQRLTALSLSTLPNWDASRKTTTIQSLDPLSHLSQLTYLELLGVCPPDKSLVPLEKCKHLQTARVSQYPLDEMARFFSATEVINEFNPRPLFS
jgi:hypothetical protein